MNFYLKTDANDDKHFTIGNKRSAKIYVKNSIYYVPSNQTLAKSMLFIMAPFTTNKSKQKECFKLFTWNKK